MHVYNFRDEKPPRIDKFLDVSVMLRTEDEYNFFNLLEREIVKLLQNFGFLKRFSEKRHFSDYFQQLLVANRNFFKGLTLERIVEISKRLDLKPPSYSRSGSAIKELYEKEKYKEIEEHLKQDLLIVRWLDLYGAKRLIEKSMKEGKALFQE